MTSVAEPSTGKIRLQIVAGDLFSVKSINTSDPVGFDPTVLRRYDAFRLGELYNSNLLAISADRAATEGVVERTFFVPLCPAKTVKSDPAEKTNGLVEVEQHSVVGRDKIAAVGIGLNSEEIARLHATFEKVRIGSHASNASVELQVSNRVQELTTFFNWRFQETTSPTSLRPLLDVRRQTEAPFEIVSEKAELGYTKQWDWDQSGLGLVIGPQIESLQTRRGLGPSDAHDFGLASQLQWTSHEYEFNRTKLGKGFRASLEAEESDKSLLSSFSALRLVAKGEVLYNFGNFDPPKMVISLRGGYWMTASPDNAEDQALLPANRRQYLGGNSDLRGFARFELPNSGAGGMSAAFTSVEVRPDLWGDRWTPLVFIDAGEIGKSSQALSSPLFWSPGLGMSWQSPVGTFRATVAHGFQSGSNDDPSATTSSHWQFYFSLGEQL